MIKIHLTKFNYPDKFWLKYRNEDNIVKYVNLSSCANNFSLLTGGKYSSEDGLRCVGWRYEKDGCLCYEIFCIGHLTLLLPLAPSLLDRIISLLQGKKTDVAYREKLQKFEKALNHGGWKTINKSDVN